MPSLHQRYQKDPSIVSRDIAGEVILVPIRQNVGDLENIYTLNPTAARAWALFDEQHTLEEVSQMIVEEFEVEEEVARRDLLELVSQLLEIKAIIEI